MTRNQIWDRARQVWEIASREIARLDTQIDQGALVKLVETLAACRARIITTGCGTSAAAARKVAHTLSCVERPAFFLSPADLPHGALGAVQPGDVVLLFSKGGGTRELVTLVPSLRAKGTCLVAVTESEVSELARAADLVVRVKVEREADPFDMLATTSTLAVLAVFDAVAVALMEHMGYTRAQFARIHPGGAVGRRLAGG